jgi:hypothetical protein
VYDTSGVLGEDEKTSLIVTVGAIACELAAEGDFAQIGRHELRHCRSIYDGPSADPPSNTTRPEHKDLDEKISPDSRADTFSVPVPCEAVKAAGLGPDQGTGVHSAGIGGDQ